MGQQAGDLGIAVECALEVAQGGEGGDLGGHATQQLDHRLFSGKSEPGEDLLLFVVTVRHGKACPNTLLLGFELGIVGEAVGEDAVGVCQVTEDL
jgi:hypothetical protein